MTDLWTLPDLASERLGGAAIAANDEFFAPKENLLREEAAVLKEGLYTERGKWMDGWETRRRREPGHDWCIVRLGAPGIVRGLVVDTAHFRGNHPEACSVEGCALEGQPGFDALDEATWTELLPKSPLAGDHENRFEVEGGARFTHLRLRIYPDGGVARLRVHGKAVPRFGHLAAAGLVDLAAAEHGARVVAVSDEFFASQHHLLLPGPPRNMGDGWETRRRRGPGHDHCIVRLGAAGEVQRVVIDTTHYKGNAPGHCSLEGCFAPDDEVPPSEAAWVELLGRTPLSPHTVHHFADEVRSAEQVSHLRLRIYPDGGIARMRAWARLDTETVQRAAVDFVNALPEERALAAFVACCGSTRFARDMTAARPFHSPDELLGVAEGAMDELEAPDWREAFDAHPRIGERAGARGEPAGGAPSAGANRSAEGSSPHARWSSEEQSGMRHASDDTRRALEEGNRAYEAKFGHVFLICATGRSPEEMRAALEERLRNDAETELDLARQEQRKITRLRLEKMLTS
jgi:allantoicase